MRFDQTKLPSDEQTLILLERQIVNSTSFKINYAYFKRKKMTLLVRTKRFMIICIGKFTIICVATVLMKSPRDVASRLKYVRLLLPTGRSLLLALVDI